MVVTLHFVALPLTRTVLASRVAYLASPAGRAYLEEQIATKIRDRYGEEALFRHQDGEGFYPGVASDIWTAELYGLPLATFIGVMGTSFWLGYHGFHVIFRKRSRAMSSESEQDSRVLG